MILDVFYRSLDELWIIYDRSFSDSLHKSVPRPVLAIGPVVDIQEWAPAQALILFKVLVQLAGIELLVIGDLYPVFLQAVLVLLQDTGGAAGR